MGEGSLGYKMKHMVDADAAKAQREGTVSAEVGTPDNPSNKVVTVANVITLCRLVLTVAFVFLFIDSDQRTLALVFYAIAASTDFLDGQVARRTKTVSWVGKIMDPVMDRVLLFSGVLALVITGALPVWVAVFVIGRDAYLFAGSIVLQHFRRRPVDVVYVGKIATALLMVGFCLLLLGQPVLSGLGWTDASWLPGLNSQSACLGIFVVYVGLVFSATAAVVYTVQGIEIAYTSTRERRQAEGEEPS